MRNSREFQTELTDGVLSLSPLRESDWDGLFAVASDRKIWEQHPSHDRWQEDVFRQFFDDALASNGCMVVRDQESGNVIGSSRFFFGRSEPDEIEIGWTFLARKYWGGTTNARMKRLMVGHALQHAHQVIFLVGHTNMRSRRAMEKIGARFTDRRYPAGAKDGEAHHVIFAMNNTEFLSSLLGRDQS